ncbi:hypothetical protein, partial [Akkermansia sp.]|uniref:hypothetical protein n=1 Tax=Akkermansia sp. TaxID=1872421 RepID=UPI003AF52908
MNIPLVCCLTEFILMPQTFAFQLSRSHSPTSEEHLRSSLFCPIQKLHGDKLFPLPIQKGFDAVEG